MNKTIRIFITLALGMGAFMQAWAAEVVVKAPFARATPPGQKISGAFMMIHNHGQQDIALISAQSDVANKVELHTHENDNGVMRMREVAKINIQASGMTALEPGGFHIMLIDLNGPLKPETSIDLRLNFDDGSSQTIKTPVRKIMQGAMNHNAKKGMAHGANHGMDHDMKPKEMDHGNMAMPQSQW